MWYNWLKTFILWYFWNLISLNWLKKSQSFSYLNYLVIKSMRKSEISFARPLCSKTMNLLFEFKKSLIHAVQCHSLNRSMSSKLFSMSKQSLKQTWKLTLNSTQGKNYGFWINWKWPKPLLSKENELYLDSGFTVQAFWVQFCLNQH